MGNCIITRRGGIVTVPGAVKVISESAATTMNIPCDKMPTLVFVSGLIASNAAADEEYDYSYLIYFFDEKGWRSIYTLDNNMAEAKAAIDASYNFSTKEINLSLTSELFNTGGHNEAFVVIYA